MQILFKHAMVLTMENDTILRDALVAVDGDKLAYVGPERVEWMDRPYDRIVDAAGSAGRRRGGQTAQRRGHR